MDWCLRLIFLLTLVSTVSCTTLIPFRLPSSLPQAPGPEVKEFNHTPNGLEVPAGKNVIRLKFQLDCNDNQYMAPGYITYQNRQYNFHLLRDLNVWDILLPPQSEVTTPGKMEVYSNFLDDPRTCKISEFSFVFLKAEEMVPHHKYAQLALIHSPVVSIRYDLLNDPFDDIPLLLGYTVNEAHHLPPGAEFEIVYQLVFSDQNASKETVSDIRAQSARWGRRNDIEWIYRVAFNKNNEPVQKLILKGLTDFKKIAQLSSDYENRPTPFQGVYLEGTQRPILYNTGRHHNFDVTPRRSKPQTRQQYYSLIPQTQYSHPHPREELIFKNTWVLKINERELASRNVLEGLATDYLYIKLFGKQLNHDIWRPYVYFIGRKEAFVVGRGEGSMRHFDKSLWNLSGYTMIYLGEENILKIVEKKERATLYLDRAVGPLSIYYPPRQQWDNIQVEKIEIYRLVKKQNDYTLENITSNFECSNTNRNLLDTCELEH